MCIRDSSISSLSHFAEKEDPVKADTLTTVTGLSTKFSRVTGRPNSDWPVSYTHLDVYKRQIHNSVIQRDSPMPSVRETPKRSSVKQAQNLV